MPLLQKMEDLRWTVVCSNESRAFRWLYVFSSGGAVTWRDENNGMSGMGTWSISGNKLSTRWNNSATVESWSVPIDTTHWTGACKMKGEDYRLHATARNFAEYSVTKAEGQIDAMACWAASLAWMSKVISSAQAKSQLTVFNENAGKFGKNGGISSQELMTASMSGIALSRKLIPAGKLEAIVKAHPFPMLIGFASGPLAGHVNVIHAYDEETGMVTVMEPWFPDPAKDSNFKLIQAGEMPVYVNKTSGEPFQFKGAHLKRPLSYYVSRPLEGKFVIGFSATIKEPAVP